MKSKHWLTLVVMALFLVLAAGSSEDEDAVDLPSVDEQIAGEEVLDLELEDETVEPVKDERTIEEKRAIATTIEYPHFLKNPDRYKGEYVTYTGEIVQITESEDITMIRLAVTEDEYGGYNWEDIVYVEYMGQTEFVEEDVVIIYGEVYGRYSYTSQAGWEITLPAVMADTIE